MIFEIGMKVRFYADRAPGIDMDAEGAAWVPDDMNIENRRPVKEGIIYDKCMNLFAIDSKNIRHMVVEDDIIEEIKE